MGGVEKFLRKNSSWVPTRRVAEYVGSGRKRIRATVGEKSGSLIHHNWGAPGSRGSPSSEPIPYGYRSAALR